MLKKDRLGEMIHGPCLEAKGGWKGSVEESSNACKKGIRLDLIRMKDPRKGNEPYLTSPSNRIARGILSVATLFGAEVIDRLEKRLKVNRDQITFDEEDLEGMSQPHDDDLVVTSRIGGFLMKRVMIDHGSRAKIMYFDMYKGLGLKPEYRSKYDTSLVGFNGKVVVPEG
nr:hypothetical protein CFP56_08714 [Quercus suber]